MNKTAKRALRATAAFAGLATTLGMSGTALAATPAAPAPTQTPSHLALGNAGAATPGMAAPSSAPSANDMHAFALPRAVKADRDDNTDGSDDLPSAERASNSHKYTDGNDRKHYAKDRESNRAEKDAEANGEFGRAHCHSDAEADSYGYGYNGDKDRDKPSSDDADEDCDGYHAAKGANRYDNGNYYGYGTEQSRQADNDYRFGGLL